MAQKGKPFSKKPMGPRTPSKGVKKPMPKILGPIKPSSPKQPIPKTPIGTPTTRPSNRGPAMKLKKAPVKKKVLVMPDKISPSKMTPAQKARYLKNPERYDG